MRRVSLAFSFFIVLTTLCALSVAQTPRRLVTAPVDESALATLGGNTPPAAIRLEYDKGAVADDMRLEHVLLLLKRDPDTEARLLAKIEALHDPGSPDFHHWLTAEQLGAQFGANGEDLEAIRAWLGSHGLSVNRLYKSGLVLDISGTAKQFGEAFHTEIHSLVLPNGQKHIANTRDPQIPAALAPAVAGAPLHDFFAQPRLTPHASGELRQRERSLATPLRGSQSGSGPQRRRTVRFRDDLQPAAALEPWHHGQGRDHRGGGGHQPCQPGRLGHVSQDLRPDWFQACHVQTGLPRVREPGPEWR